METRTGFGARETTVPADGKRPWGYRRCVRYYETDRMGVVHQSNYMRYLEEARTEWMRDAGIPYSEMERMGIIVPCTASFGQFRAFLHFDESFTVYTRLTAFNGVRLTFSYEIYRDLDGALCYEGYTEHCTTRDGDYMPISVRKKYPELYALMMEHIS